MIEETIMLGLRQAKGVSVSKLKSLGCDILKEKADEIAMLVQKGIIQIENDRIKLTESNFGLCSAVVLQLI